MQMPKGIKGSGKPAKKKPVARKRSSAKLKVDESFFHVPMKSTDEFIYREALATSISLHAGKAIPLEDLLSDAVKIANFFKGIPPAGTPLVDELLPQPAPPALDIPQENHKSKFEITM